MAIDENPGPLGAVDMYWQCQECGVAMTDLVKRSLRFPVSCRCGRSTDGYMPRVGLQEVVRGLPTG